MTEVERIDYIISLIRGEIGDCKRRIKTLKQKRKKLLEKQNEKNRD